MNNLKLIIKREFIAKVRNKAFVVMTFLSPLIVIGMIALVVFLSKANIENTKVIGLFDRSQLFGPDDFKKVSGTAFIDLSEMDLEMAMEVVKEKMHFGLLMIPDDENLNTVATQMEFFSIESPSLMLVADLEGVIEQKLREKRLQELGVDIKEMKEVNIDADIKLLNFSGEITSKLINGMKMGIGMAGGYLIMMFIIIYGAMVMRSVIEEKTSRIIEIIISSVKPFQLMLGKIVGTALAGLLQFFIWSVILGILSLMASVYFGIDFMDVNAVNMSGEQAAVMNTVSDNDMQLVIQEIFKLPLFSIFISFIIYFIGGYLLYSSIYAAIGSAVDNETDTQQFMLPVIVPLVLGVYVGFASVISDPNGPIAVIFSMIPFTSPIVMLMRIPFGVPWWQIVSSLLLLFGTFLGIVWFAAKIYRVGILMYGKKPSYRELYKWLKY